MDLSPTHLVLSDSKSVAVSSVQVVAGVPRQKFRKELIRDGVYVKDGKHFRVDRTLRLHWEKLFKAMQTDGIDVPVPADHTMKAKDNHGYIRDLVSEGSSLFGILEMIGAEGIELAQRNNVSIYSPVEWVDGNGKKWERPIVHVALTPYPVVPGLSPAEAIAASFQGEDFTMGMNWKKIQAALKLEQDITDDKAEDILLAALSARDKSIADLNGKLEGVKKQLSDIKLSHETEVKELKLANEPKKPDKQLVKISGELRTAKIDKLVSDQHICKSVASDLKAAFATGEGLELSLARDDDTFDKVVAALTKNTLVELNKERTGPQVLELSHNTGEDKTGKMLLDDADKRLQAANSRNNRW